MNEIGLTQFEFKITPEDYLKQLFAHTEEGVLFLSQQEPEEDLPRHYRCQMNWTEADLTALLEEYNSMIVGVFETVMEAGTAAESVMSDVLAAVRELVPEESEVKNRVWRVCSLMKLEAPDVIIQNEICELMEALALCRFCTAQESL